MADACTFYRERESVCLFWSHCLVSCIIPAVLYFLCLPLHSCLMIHSLTHIWWLGLYTAAMLFINDRPCIYCVCVYVLGGREGDFCHFFLSYAYPFYVLCCQNIILVSSFLILMGTMLSVTHSLHHSSMYYYIIPSVYNKCWHYLCVSMWL